MTATSQPEPERTTLTYCVAGLKPREELLVKSYIRLLDRTTLHQWLYQPPAGGVRVDLLIAAPGAKNG